MQFSRLIIKKPCGNVEKEEVFFEKTSSLNSINFFMGINIYRYAIKKEMGGCLKKFKTKIP